MVVSRNTREVDLITDELRAAGQALLDQGLTTLRAYRVLKQQYPAFETDELWAAVGEFSLTANGALWNVLNPGPKQARWRGPDPRPEVFTTGCLSCNHEELLHGEDGKCKSRNCRCERYVTHKEIHAAAAAIDEIRLQMRGEEHEADDRTGRGTGPVGRGATPRGGRRLRGS